MGTTSSTKMLGLIPARAGSRRLPGKNTKLIAGKPLIAWTIEAGLKASCVDRLILSSDDEDAIRIARAQGCEVPFKRPAELASDTATSLDMVLHVLDYIDADAQGFEWLALLQPTSPLRRASDIDNAFQLCLETGASSCISVSELPKPADFFGTVAGTSFYSGAFLAPETNSRPCIVNGAIYLTRISALRAVRAFTGADTVAYVMPFDRSIDIDEPTDFIMAEALLKEER